VLPTPSSYLRADLYETPTEFKLLMDCAGVTKESLNLDVESDVLRISIDQPVARMEPGDKEGDVQWHRCERLAARGSRALRFPTSADLSKVQARLENGILHVCVAKQPRQARRQLNISAGAPSVGRLGGGETPERQGTELKKEVAQPERQWAQPERQEPQLERQAGLRVLPTPSGATMTGVPAGAGTPLAAERGEVGPEGAPVLRKGEEPEAPKKISQKIQTPSFMTSQETPQLGEAFSPVQTGEKPEKGFGERVKETFGFGEGAAGGSQGIRKGEEAGKSAAGEGRYGRGGAATLMHSTDESMFQKIGSKFR
jgi:HSP20 family molecular chaperone IbpA